MATEAAVASGQAAEEEDGEVVIEEVERDAPVSGAAAAAGADDETGGAAAAEPDDDEGVADPRPPDKRETDEEIDKIEKEKEGMSATDKLEHAFGWKIEGNDFFKKSEIFRAADAYYHAIIYCRDLTQNPQYYPNLKHNEEQRKMAKGICETCFTNLALVQTKYALSLALDHVERSKVLSEAEKSACEALKLNANNVKALYRRAQARMTMQQGPGVTNGEGQKLLGDAKADLMAVVEKDPQNREARAELKTLQDRLRQLKKEEVAGEKRQFSFASTLSAVGAKEKDLLKDGSIRKQIVSSGDGGLWLNDDWLSPSATTKCIVHVKCKMLSSGGADGAASKSSSAPVTISFILGQKDMHDGMTVAVKSMSVGEVAHFVFAPSRLQAESSLAKQLPSPGGEPSAWEVTFVKFVTWEDIRRDCSRLIKIQDEGYGKIPDPLSEVHVHWRVFGPTGDMIHSSRYTLNFGGQGGLQPVEDEDKAAPVYILGENMWEPLSELCRRLRQGGVGELRMRQMPALPQDNSGDGKADVARISMMMSKAKGGENLEHCVLRAEVERVVLPVAGPDDPRWEGFESLVQERFRGEELLAGGSEGAALARLRRALGWAEALVAQPELAATARKELAACRASIGWALACRAAPVLDLGNVSSEVIKAARRDIEEAEVHCAWLEQCEPESVGARVLRAKILVAQDDDFAGAHQHLLAAQAAAPQDPRVQEELRKVKVELRKQEEVETKAKVVDIRDRLKRARTGEGGESQSSVVPLLTQLLEAKVCWDTVMETRIGVELKCCQEQCGDEAQRLCREILGKFKDESKEQRPMWES